MATPRRTIGELWATYERAILSSPQVSLVQRQETRCAFYAGAHAMFTCVTEDLDADHEPTAADLQYMDHLQSELATFMLQVQRGRA